MASVDSESNVYRGVWTNWSRGGVMGSTLTLNRNEGNLLIAFTASFIAFVSVHFWKILSLTYHRHLSTPTPQSTVRSQRQVILRNTANPESALALALATMKAWWRRSKKTELLLVMVPLLFLSILSWAAFTVAGGFSSLIASSAETMVLLRSRDCGFPGRETVADAFPARYGEMTKVTNNAMNYVRQCYSGDASGEVDCGRFVTSKLAWETDTHAACPFDDAMCRSADQNIRMDTGMINTNSVLGLNAPAHEQSALRYVLQCAPLVTDGFTTRITTQNTTQVRYHYGSVIVFEDSLDPAAGYKALNHTYEMSDVESQYQFMYDPGSRLLSGYNFRLIPVRAPTVNGKPAPSAGDLVPLPSLARSDGDVIIMFLSANGVSFQEPWNDDWYRATVPGQKVLLAAGDGLVVDLYQPEEAASPLACVEQHQFCNLGGGGAPKCGPLGSFADAIMGAGPAFNWTVEAASSTDPPQDNPTATRLWWMAMIRDNNSNTLKNVISILGNKALASQAYLYQSIQMRPPPSSSSPSPEATTGPPWQADVNDWFATVLATLQGAFINTPLGPLTEAAAAIRVRADGGPDQAVLCNSQIIRSSRYTSFSMFGLCFTYVVGSLIVLASVLLEPVLHWLARRKGGLGFQAYQQAAWTTDGALQLHRMAQEERGYGGRWSRCDDKVPITTEQNALLGGLDASDPAHPVIMKQQPGNIVSSLSPTTTTTVEHEEEE